MNTIKNYIFILFFTFTLSLTFLISFIFSSLQTFYLNTTIPLSLYLPLFYFFLLSSFQYKFVISSSILCIIFPHQKEGYFPLFLPQLFSHAPNPIPKFVTMIGMLISNLNLILTRTNLTFSKTFTNAFLFLFIFVSLLK